jgi:hypothetical protein
VSKNVPRFLDLDLDDQQERFLLQAWMYSEPAASLHEADDVNIAHSQVSYGGVVQYDPNALLGTCSASNQMQFIIPDLAIDISGGIWDCQFCGQATATATAIPVVLSDPPAALPAEEPESASIETERVIAFRSIRPEARHALHRSNVRLSPQAVSFVAKTRSRQLRFEESDEQQSE